MDQEAMLVRISEWAETDDNIRAVVVTGSVARGDHDELSDVDVELYVREPSALLDRRDWYEHFGQVLAVEELDNPGWKTTRLLYLVDGKIDFAIGGVDSFATEPYVRGFRVLVDKDGRSTLLDVEAHSSQRRPPSADEFDECLNWFAAAALMQAKLIVRREPWAAKYRDWDLKAQLLRMMMWDHRCRYGWDYDTWYNGKHIDDWVDPDIRRRLDACWAGFPVSEMVPPLRASMSLFRELADRTGTALSLPDFHHDLLGQEVDRILGVRLVE